MAHHLADKVYDTCASFGSAFSRVSPIGIFHWPCGAVWSGAHKMSMPSVGGRREAREAKSTGYRPYLPPNFAEDRR